MTMRRVDGCPEKRFGGHPYRSWGYWFGYNRYLRKALARDDDEPVIVGETTKYCRVETDMTPAPIEQHRASFVPLFLVAMLAVLAFGALLVARP